MRLRHQNILKGASKLVKTIDLWKTQGNLVKKVKK